MSGKVYCITYCICTAFRCFSNDFIVRSDAVKNLRMRDDIGLAPVNTDFAKFLFLPWGGRGRTFESCRSDQYNQASSQAAKVLFSFGSNPAAEFTSTMQFFCRMIARHGSKHP